MAILKVSVYQKSLSEGLTPATLKKLAALKSDFLLLPEYFFAGSGVKNPAESRVFSEQALQWLLKLNDHYKGIIIGGSMHYAENGSVYCGTPILSEGTIVDWYRKRKLNQYETAAFSPGEDVGIFILRGHRFAVLSGDDAREANYFAELAEMGISLVFAVVNADNEQAYAEYAKKFGMYIARCGSAQAPAWIGADSRDGTAGGSLVATPSGISWRVARQEEGMEILKTVMVNIHAG